MPTLALTVGVGTIMDAREESGEVNRRKGRNWDRDGEKESGICM